MANINVSTLIATETHNLFLKFTQDGVPIDLSYTSKPSGESTPFAYVVFCDQGEDCSGFSVNTSSQTITLKNAIFKNRLIDPADTSGDVILNGVVKYEL